MCKFCSVIKWFVFISFSLNWLKADLILNEKNIQAIKDLSKKDKFQKADVYKCFSLFGFTDGNLYFSQTAGEIMQILKEGKKDVVDYDILANLQKILAKFLVYNIQCLSIHPVNVDLAESCFQRFNEVLLSQDKDLIKNTFFRKKADFFKFFVEEKRQEIIRLSDNETFSTDEIKQCFSLFANSDVDDVADDQVYEKCINVLIGLIAAENLRDSSDVLLPLQKILKNVFVFYMGQYDELSIKSFYFKFKDLLQGVLGVFPENYKSELKQCFDTLLKNLDRVGLSTKEDVDAFDKLDQWIYAHKANYNFSLRNFNAVNVNKNLKLLQSASIYLDRFPSSEDGVLNKFIFFFAKKESDRGKSVVVPEIHCFLSLENKDVDLTDFSVRLYNKKSIFEDVGKRKEVSLYPYVEGRKFECLKEIKLSMLESVDALRVSDSTLLEPSLNKWIPGDLLQKECKGLLADRREDEKAVSSCLMDGDEKNLFHCLFWKSCLQEKNAEVQHVLTNFSLGESGLGDKFLCIKDSINRENTEQQLEIRVHVFATDELLFKALQTFGAKQEQEFPELMFLDYNEQKGCFELLNVSYFQSKKKAICGKLDQKYEALKNSTENIVNQQKIDELMDILLKQRESDSEELDMAMVQEVEDLLENEEEVRKLTLAIKEICEERGKVVKAFGEMQSELKEKVEGLKELRQKVNSLNRKEGVNVDLEEGFKSLRQAHTELEKCYNKLQEGSKDSKLLESESWDRLQTQSRKNAEDLAAFQQQEAEHERAWQLYKEEIKQKQEAEQKRQKEDAERRRRIAEEEARKPKGVTGQQIFDYIQRTATPGKKNAATRLIRANKITPSQLYTNRNQIPSRLQSDFDALMSEQN